jgi:cell division protein FtsB
MDYCKSLPAELTDEVNEEYPLQSAVTIAEAQYTEYQKLKLNKDTILSKIKELRDAGDFFIIENAPEEFCESRTDYEELSSLYI